MMKEPSIFDMNAIVDADSTRKDSRAIKTPIKTQTEQLDSRNLELNDPLSMAWDIDESKNKYHLRKFKLCYILNDI